jgi:hypothetical protein
MPIDTWGKIMLPQEAANHDRIMVLISALCSTLSNIDAEFEFEVARVRSTARPDLRPVILHTVRKRHMQRREPYVRQLAALRSRITTREQDQGGTLQASASQHQF